MEVYVKVAYRSRRFFIQYYNYNYGDLILAVNIMYMFLLTVIAVISG